MVCTIKHFVKICLPPVLSSVQNLKIMDESTHKSWRSSVVEQLTCNQQVGGSNPFASSTRFDFGYRISDIGFKREWFYSAIRNQQSAIAGEVAEWTKAADCKSAGVSLRRFESFPPHHLNSEFGIRNSDSKNSALSPQSAISNPKLKQAGVAQLVRASAFQAEGRGFESRLPLYPLRAHVAQAVEHILGKDVVGGSIPPVGSILV